MSNNNQSGSKRYLTKREIHKIESRSNRIYFEYPDEKNLPRERTIHTEIVAHSERNRLILIKGNEDTGHKHIRLRHNFWSLSSYIIDDGKGGQKFQNQSRFPLSTAMKDELEIADSVYSRKNLLIENKNSESHLFDVYNGVYEINKNKLEKVRLVLYKNTKIIHTLFFIRDKYSKKKIKGFPFKREKIEVNKFPSESRKEIFIPYININRDLVYGIHINKLFEPKVELLKLIIICDDSNYSKEVQLGQRELIYFESDYTELITYQHKDLLDFERLILKIEKGLKSGELKLRGVSR
jgi:hypothetical protein